MIYKSKWEKEKTAKQFEREMMWNRYVFRKIHPAIFSKSEEKDSLKDRCLRVLFSFIHFLRGWILVIVLVACIIIGLIRIPVFIDKEIPTIRIEYDSTLVYDTIHIKGVLWKHSFATDIFVGSFTSGSYQAEAKCKIYKKPAGFGYSGFKDLDMIWKDIKYNRDNEFRFWDNGYVYKNFSKIILLSHDTYIAGPSTTEDEYNAYMEAVKDIKKNR